MHQQEPTQGLAQDSQDSHAEVSWTSNGVDHHHHHHQQQQAVAFMFQNGDHPQHQLQTDDMTIPAKQQQLEFETRRKHVQHHHQHQHQQQLHPSRLPMHHQMSGTSHDHICSHLYHNGYLQGLYADLVVRIQQQGAPGFKISVDGLLFNLHRIIAIRSPVLATLLHEQELSGEYPSMASITLATDDQTSLRRHGGKTETDRSSLLRAVFASAHLLNLPDLMAMASDYIRDDISSSSVLGYCHFVSQQNSARYGAAVVPLRENVFAFLCRGLTAEISDKLGLIWPKKDGEGYQMLVSLFSELPFEWLKRTVESKSFEVASELERFAFAKEIIQLRARSRSPSTPSLIMAGDENVVLSFGGGKTGGSGVTIVRKAPRDVIYKLPRTGFIANIGFWSC
ncbi:hypothetical protein BASA84_001752 [Batrachochytrium salamandrivorans]|nr:hypothetical protein BASA84_001752 [Batrachochytrium salamandrivorans]